MRTREIRVFTLSIALISSLALAAAPQSPEHRDRDVPPIIKIVKKVVRGITTLGDSLTIPKP